MSPAQDQWVQLRQDALSRAQRERAQREADQQHQQRVRPVTQSRRPQSQQQGPSPERQQIYVRPQEPAPAPTTRQPSFDDIVYGGWQPYSQIPVTDEPAARTDALELGGLLWSDEEREDKPRVGVMVLISLAALAAAAGVLWAAWELSSVLPANLTELLGL